VITLVEMATDEVEITVERAGQLVMSAAQDVIVIWNSLATRQDRPIRPARAQPHTSWVE